MFVRKWFITAAVAATWFGTQRQAVAGGSLLESAFTFQGKVALDGSELNDTADFLFTLWDADAGGNQIGVGQAFDNLIVLDGLFAVDLDFGPAAFNGGGRWVEIQVRSPAGVGIYSTLSPRQPINAAPYALHTRGLYVQNNGFASVGGSGQVTGADWFGVKTPAPDGQYGGMYLDTEGADGWPFYGYATNGVARAWHYFDGVTDQWKLYNGVVRMTVNGDDGNVGIGTDDPFARLDVRQSASNAVGFSSSYTGSSGNAGLFNASNASNAETALSTVHAGPGKAFLAYNYGTGKAAEITIDNPISNAVAALEVNNNGFGFGIDVNAGIAGIRVTTTEDDSAGLIASGRGVGVNAVASHSQSVLPTWGGIFQNASLEGGGVFGRAGNPSGNGNGVHGIAHSSSGIGVYGENDSPGGTAIKGEVTEPSGTGIGVHGRAPFYGVVGEATEPGIGVIASCLVSGGDGLYASSVDARGVAAFTGSTNVNLAGVLGQGNAAGVRGIATTASGTAYGVFGQTSSSTGYGGYFEGRGYFSGDVGIGMVPPVYRLDVREASETANVVHFERQEDAASGADLLELVMGGGSDANSQFIECEKAGDIEFRVWGDGDVSADGVFTPGGADYAEMVRVTTGAVSVSAGDLMIIDVNNPRAVVQSQQARSTLVAGIYSTRPGVVGSEHDWDVVAAQLDLGIDTENADEGPNGKPMEIARMIDEVPVAVVGIVPCNVSAENGPIRPGDLLVTSDTPGHAMRDDNPRTGTVVGKAMGSLDSGRGSIKVLVTLQ